MKNICVVGGGRMGLPLAATFAQRGGRVTVCDIDRDLVGEINAGRCPYEEPGLADLISALHGEGRLNATSDTAGASAEADAIVIIVPAHLNAHHDIDLGPLSKASTEVGKGLRRDALVVYETTLSVGSTRRNLVPLLEEYSGLQAGKDFFVGYSPERVKANLVLQRLQSTPKVVGGLDEASLERTRSLYAQYLGAPIDAVGTLEAAEMTKLVGMLYRDVNIALANELAGFCELCGIDFELVRAAANRDGEADLLDPGIGVGGHCTPVYPYFLTGESRRLGMIQRIAEAAREINDLQPARQLARVAAAWRPWRGQPVHLLGLGFRPGVKVDTFSPAYPLRDELVRQGAQVTIGDPHYSEAEIRLAGFEPGRPEDARVVVLNTAHPQFASPDFAAWHRQGVEVVLDGRSAWDPRAAEAAGLLYFGIGRAARVEAGRRSDRV
jgi:nucleotide sugar dehydrogenase